MTETKFKVSIGAVIGSIIVGGATYASLNNLKGRTLVPFCQENIKSYTVNTKTISADSKNNGIIEETIDKKYVLEEYLEDVNKVELNIYSPWTKKEKNGRDVITRNTDQYIFDYDSLTAEELDEMINFLQSGNFKELAKNYDLSMTYTESPIIIPEEEKEEDVTKAEMTIYDIDYNDVQVEKQSKEENFEETMLLILASLIGGGLGSLTQATHELKYDIKKMEREEKNKIKVKKI